MTLARFWKILEVWEIREVREVQEVLEVWMIWMTSRISQIFPEHLQEHRAFPLLLALSLLLSTLPAFAFLVFLFFSWFLIDHWSLLCVHNFLVH